MNFLKILFLSTLFSTKNVQYLFYLMDIYLRESIYFRLKNIPEYHVIVQHDYFLDDITYFLTTFYNQIMCNVFEI